MDTSNITIELAYRIGEKSNDKESAIVVQLSFYKDKINILKNCKKFKRTKISIFKDFSPRCNANSKRKNGRRYYLTENKVTFRTSTIEVLFSRKGEHQHSLLSDFLSQYFFIVNSKQLLLILFAPGYFCLIMPLGGHKSPLHKS